MTDGPATRPDSFASSSTWNPDTGAWERLVFSVTANGSKTHAAVARWDEGRRAWAIRTVACSTARVYSWDNTSDPRNASCGRCRLLADKAERVIGHGSMA